ncbi:predicted protein, partial [Nematostella vectensis]
EFLDRHYVPFIESLLRSTTVGFYSTLDQKKKAIFEAFFLDGIPSQSLAVLLSSLERLSKSDDLLSVTAILERFITSSKLVDIFTYFCIDGNAAVTQQRKSELHRKQIITLIVSIPERVANKQGRNAKLLFLPNEFSSRIVADVLDALTKIHNTVVSTSCHFSLRFMSELLGRLSMAGLGVKLISKILPTLEKLMSTSPFWHKLCSDLITGVPDHTMEPVVESLVKQVRQQETLTKFFGESIESRPRLKYLLTTKFLLLRYHADSNVLANIIGYLASLESHQTLVDTTKVLFDNWSNKSALKHTPYNHHLFISCGLVHAVGYLTQEEKAALRQSLLGSLLNGVQIHLENPVARVRELGMVVAEVLTSALDTEGDKLSFDYKESSDSKLIKEFAKGKDAIFNKANLKNTPEEIANDSEADIFEMTERTSKLGVSHEHHDADDDDLEPYEIEEEFTEEQKAPRHLRDCIDGLLESDKPEKTEAALQALDKLVCSNPDDLPDVCVELVKILLHLQDKFSTENFILLRHNAMVAVAVRFPKEIAGYLTEEFFAANYNISQRLDMLSVLTATAQFLSEPQEIQNEKNIPKRFPLPNLQDLVLDKTPHWQKIVQERIESKTKRFAKGPSNAPLKQVMNKFSNVAGHFFYPLMKNFDHKLKTLDLLGEDSFVLGRLVHTLGIVMYSARGTLGARNMAATLIEFTWALRYHPEAYIRRMLVFSQIMVLVSVPITVLFEDCTSELLEIQEWLKDLVQRDSDTEVREIALQGLSVMERIFKDECAGTSG